MRTREGKYAHGEIRLRVNMRSLTCTNVKPVPLGRLSTARLRVNMRSLTCTNENPLPPVCGRG